MRQTFSYKRPNNIFKAIKKRSLSTIEEQDLVIDRKI
jgi:hypothetical protein